MTEWIWLKFCEYEIEIVICSQLLDYLESNHLLPNNQHGFRPKRSTMTVWQEIQLDWAIKSEKDLICCKFQPAFGCYALLMFVVVMVRSNSMLRFVVVKRRYIFNIFFGHVQWLMFVVVNFSVMFQYYCSSLWKLFGHISTTIWSSWFGHVN